MLNSKYVLSIFFSLHGSRTSLCNVIYARCIILQINVNIIDICQATNECKCIFIYNSISDSIKVYALNELDDAVTLTYFTKPYLVDTSGRQGGTNLFPSYND